MKYSNQQSEKQCRASSFPKTTQNLIAKPYLCLTQILCQLVDKSFVNWLTSWANQRELQSRSSGILNWNKFAGVFGLSTIKTIKAIKETTPTLLQPHIGNATAWLHAPIMLPFNVRRRGKSLCCSSIEHDYHLPTAGFFVVHRISHAILGLSLGLKMHWSKSVNSCHCDQQS